MESRFWQTLQVVLGFLEINEMGRTKSKQNSTVLRVGADPGRIAALNQKDPVGGVTGPGRWLIAEYQPTALFSLKASQATSSVGVSLVIPTPYAIKMAFVDAAFRAGLRDGECEEVLQSLATVDVRISPTPVAIVTNTFVKVRQESRNRDPLRPYGPTIAYREVVYLGGSWHWAFDLACGDDLLAERLARLAPYIGYVGKRGSFVQFTAPLYRRLALPPEFTQPINGGEPWTPPQRSHVRDLDDFGPEADLNTLSSFTSVKPRREKHRRFVPTVIPVGMVNAGPGFSEYRGG